MNKSISFSLEVIIEKDHDNEYFAHSQDFEGVLAGGNTKEEALENFKELFKEYIHALIKYDRPIPCFSHFKETKKCNVKRENIDIGQLIAV